MNVVKVNKTSEGAGIKLWTTLEGRKLQMCDNSLLAWHLSRPTTSCPAVNLAFPLCSHLSLTLPPTHLFPTPLTAPNIDTGPSPLIACQCLPPSFCAFNHCTPASLFPTLGLSCGFWIPFTCPLSDAFVFWIDYSVWPLAWNIFVFPLLCVQIRVCLQTSQHSPVGVKPSDSNPLQQERLICSGWHHSSRTKTYLRYRGSAGDLCSLWAQPAANLWNSCRGSAAPNLLLPLLFLPVTYLQLPWLLPPEHYLRSVGACHSPLVQCSCMFKLYWSSFSTQQCHWLHRDHIREQQSPSCSSRFSIKLFDHTTPGLDGKLQITELNSALVSFWIASKGRILHFTTIAKPMLQPSLHWGGGRISLWAALHPQGRSWKWWKWKKERMAVFHLSK